MNKKNITLMVVAVLTLITFVGLATYAYFTGNINTTRTSNVTATTERNNLVFDTNGGAMQLNVSAVNMQRAKNGTVAAQNSTTLTVNLTANTNYSMVCTYDIVYEWTSTDKYTSHSSGVSSNEFTIKASLASNSNTYEGTNNIANETDLSSLTYTNNLTTVVSGAQIDATGTTRSTAVWTLESKIYNVNANQTNLVNKNFCGRFKITNVSCVAGNVTATLAGPTSYWFQGYDGLGSVEYQYSFPEHADELQASGTATGHNSYMGQDDTKYYTCINVDGKEACLSQPYTQYGLEGHTLNNNFTTAEQNAAKAAIGEVFSDAGITGYSCYSDSYEAYCDVDNRDYYSCKIESDGRIGCHYVHYGYEEFTYVYPSGDAETKHYTCFAEGTKILIKNGYKNIEDITQGDEVYSFNEDTGKVELRKVLETYVHSNNKIYELKVGNNTINVTDNHPFYVKGKYAKEYRWVKVKDIKVGDHLYSFNGTSVIVNRISVKYEQNKVYNFSVERNNNYYVTESGYLVHNYN